MGRVWVSFVNKEAMIVFMGDLAGNYGKWRLRFLFLLKVRTPIDMRCWLEDLTTLRLFFRISVA